MKWIGILAFALLLSSIACATQTKEINGQNYTVIGEDVRLYNGIVYDVFGGKMSPATPLNSNTELWTSRGAVWVWHGGADANCQISGYVSYHVPPKK